ncbi:MAG: 2-oxo acid dehydrogenase subunit E2, partial [Actinomycetota bacterium]|nr:2-oxo acid dehydrogenase subunit E2 [Actinomycetota bacterium]
MPELKQFLLPDVGEGLTEADILSWAVAPGDTVVVNQTLVEVETAKAAVELPSPFAGVVREIHAAPGDTVEVGRPIITIDVAPGAVATPSGGPTPSGAAPSAGGPSGGASAGGEPTSLAQTDLVPTVAGSSGS